MHLKYFIVILAITCASCGERIEEHSEVKSQLGTTCYSTPHLKHKTLVGPSGRFVNVCRQPGESFHGGAIGIIFAKQTAITECKTMNALDHGYLAGEGKSCVKQCEISTHCVILTNN